MKDKECADHYLEISQRLDQLCNLAWSHPEAGSAIIETAQCAIEKLGYLALDGWGVVGQLLAKRPCIPTAYIIHPHDVSSGIKEAAKFPTHFSKKKPGRLKKPIPEGIQSRQLEAEGILGYLVLDFINAILPTNSTDTIEVLRKARKIDKGVVARLTEPTICTSQKIWKNEFLAWLKIWYPITLKESDRTDWEIEGDSSPLDHHGYFWILGTRRIFRTDGKRKSAKSAQTNPEVALGQFCIQLMKKDFRLRHVLGKKSLK